jgi:hypothetical protein
VYVSSSPSGSVPSAVNSTVSGALPDRGTAPASTVGARFPGGSVTVTTTSAVPVLPPASVTVTVAV